MRRAALLFLIACGGSQPATPSPPPPVAVTIPADAGSLPSSDPGILVENNASTRLPDGTVLIAHEDHCVEVESSNVCLPVDTGEVEVLVDKWLLYRDIDHRFRVRKLEVRNVELRGHRVSMAIGDRAALEGLTLQWHGVARVQTSNLAVIEIAISHPSWPEPKRIGLTTLNPRREVPVPKSHAVVTLSLESVNDEVTAIEILEWTSDESRKAGFGDSLDDGEYVFPDGLRVRYVYNRNCEYDPSVPCIWRHHITASKNNTEKSLELTRTTPTGSALGHTFHVVNDKLVVR